MVKSMKNIKYLLLVSILAFSILPHFAFAMTVEELIAKIKELEQQIAQLKVQLTQAQGQAPAWCYDFLENLKIGNKGEATTALHTVLEKEGFNVFDEEKVDKEFGESTASAVSGFQQKYRDEILTPLGLKYGTGFLGKATRTKLNALYGCSVKASPAPFCSPVAASCESNSKIVCPAGLDEKGCPFPCKCVPVACTMEAKICSDGSTVSRIPPSCEFASCPTEKTNQPPVIYGISGPTFLKTNEIGTWTVKASDPEQSLLTFTVFWGDNSGPQPLKPNTSDQIASFTHSYSQAGTYNLTFTVADEQGLSTKMGVSAKVEETISSLVVQEQVKCLFKESQTEQKCYAASENYYGYGCSGKEACVMDLKGKKGDRITWKSSCGGYAYTTMDGQNEYAEFSCAANTVVSIAVLSPNGGETWELGKAYEIKWKQTQDASVSIVVRNKQLPGSANSLWYSMYINTATGKAGENRQWWDIPNYLNPHQGYEICISGYFAGLAVEDCSDAPFYIKEVTLGTTAKTCEELSAEQNYYFDFCGKEGFDGVCFNKFSSVYQGCSKSNYNDCTASNANADKNILCQATVTATTIPITPAPTTPSVSVAPTIVIVSPNGGERWEIGKTYIIQWKTSEVPADAKIGIRLNFSGSTTQITPSELSNLINDGSETWTVPATTPVGKYIVDVFTYFTKNGASYYLVDASNDAISVESPVTVFNDIENFLASISQAVSQLGENVKELMGR